MPATVKADRLAAERLQKKRHRAEETTEERAAELYTILCKVQPATVSCFECHAGVAQVLCNGKG